jgi:hypothetical protein
MRAQPGHLPRDLIQDIQRISRPSAVSNTPPNKRRPINAAWLDDHVGRAINKSYDALCLVIDPIDV